MKRTTLILVTLAALLGLTACDGGEAIKCTGGDVPVNGSCMGPAPNPYITCSADSGCETGLTCQNGECKTKAVVLDCNSDADCVGGLVCVDGTCAESVCVPDCTGKACGDDGCGGNCGTCGDGFTCNSAGLCAGGGGDPNEGCDTNADCAAGEACIDGVCKKTACTPNCFGKGCGADGCGGSCGTCGTGKMCSSVKRQCIDIPPWDKCVPNCLNRNCGDDGCGGSCGICNASQTCSEFGQCKSIEPVCKLNCAGKTCGDDGCGGNCGACTYGFTCNAGGHCIDDGNDGNGSNIIAFPDLVLKKAVKSALGLSKDKNVTVADCLKLTKLTWTSFNYDNGNGCKTTPDSSKIKQLTGLELCTNLKEISLQCNQISNIGAIGSLTQINKINLQYNQIKFISPLLFLNNGLGSGDVIHLEGNPLGAGSEGVINDLTAKGVTVYSDIGDGNEPGGKDPTLLNLGDKTSFVIVADKSTPKPTISHSFELTKEGKGCLPKGIYKNWTSKFYGPWWKISGHFEYTFDKCDFFESFDIKHTVTVNLNGKTNKKTYDVHIPSPNDESVNVDKIFVHTYAAFDDVGSYSYMDIFLSQIDNLGFFYDALTLPIAKYKNLPGGTAFNWGWLDGIDKMENSAVDLHDYKNVYVVLNGGKFFDAMEYDFQRVTFITKYYYLSLFDKGDKCGDNGEYSLLLSYELGKSYKDTSKLQWKLRCEPVDSDNPDDYKYPCGEVEKGDTDHC